MKEFLQSQLEAGIQVPEAIQIKLTDTRITSFMASPNALAGVLLITLFPVFFYGGKTFGEEIVLRDDGVNWDLGYPTTTENQKGQLVTVYYMKENDDPNENRICYTIWEK